MWGAAFFCVLALSLYVSVRELVVEAVLSLALRCFRIVIDLCF